MNEPFVYSCPVCHKAEHDVDCPMLLENQLSKEYNQAIERAAIKRFVEKVRHWRFEGEDDYWAVYWDDIERVAKEEGVEL